MKFASGGILCALVLMGAGSAQADGLPDPHFTINLNNCVFVGNTCVFPTDPNGFGGWAAGQEFTDQINTDMSTEGFSQNSLDCSECPEPSMIVNKGGKSSPFPTSFNANGNGGGFLDFFNGTGQTITDILIQTEFDATQSYSCASDIFAFCGFMVEDGPPVLDILYSNGNIPPLSDSVPEPTSGVLLLTATGAILLGRKLRSRRN